MTANSKIEWCDATWNPVRGCSRVSEGCRHCYAEIMAARFNKPGQWGHGFAEMVTRPGGNREARWTGLVKLDRSKLGLPFEWRKPRRIFVNSTSDLFHETLDFSDIDKVFAMMALARHHTFLVLTKRPERMRQYAAEPGFSRRMGDALKRTRAPLPNVWLGTSVEDQATADERIPSLLATPAAGRFVSAEPLLGQLDLRDLPWPPGWKRPIDDVSDGIDGLLYCGTQERGLDWVIVGGESGPGARPMHPAWVRSIRDQCAAAGIPLFFKQWGEWNTAAFNLATNQRVFRQFLSFEQWVNKAPTWIQGGVCLDNTGRVCSSGADFERARDENTFPITVMHRVGKSRAGRRLEGITHDALPPLPITSPLAGEVATPKLRRSEGRAGEGDRR